MQRPTVEGATDVSRDGKTSHVSGVKKFERGSDEVREIVNDLIRPLQFWEALLRLVSMVTWLLETHTCASGPALPSSSISTRQNWRLPFEVPWYFTLDIPKRVLF